MRPKEMLATEVALFETGKIGPQVIVVVIVMVIYR
jgi:hypothetical protein